MTCNPGPKYSNTQVLVTSISLPKMMELKINALLDRQEIRDAFDVELLNYFQTDRNVCFTEKL